MSKLMKRFALGFYGASGAVTDPIFSPNAGNYTSAQNVAITCATPGATIRYTTNGSAPSHSNGTVYSGPVVLSDITTLKAIAYKASQDDSGGVLSDRHSVSERAIGRA